jgi:sugar-specific transcriptional regulator TrmB
MKAYTGAHGYAFMSYSHKDEEKIKPLIEKLQSVGCNIWYDEGILPADEWAETIAKKLAGASLFFLILSENAAASQNVKREIYYAVSHDLPILTFYLENVSLSQGLEMQLGISQAVHTQNNTEHDYATIKSDVHIMAKLRNMIDNAKFRIYFSADKDIVAKLNYNLREAVKRGLKVVIITGAPYSLENAQVYHGREDSTQVRLITDSANALTGDYVAGNDRCTCLYSGKQNLVDLIRDALKNEIRLITIKGTK